MPRSLKRQLKEYINDSGSEMITHLMLAWRDTTGQIHMSVSTNIEPGLDSDDIAEFVASVGYSISQLGSLDSLIVGEDGSKQPVAKTEGRGL